jgi:hypothetical protein
VPETRVWVAGLEAEAFLTFGSGCLRHTRLLMNSACTVEAVGVLAQYVIRELNGELWVPIQ